MKTIINLCTTLNKLISLIKIDGTTILCFIIVISTHSFASIEHNSMCIQNINKLSYWEV